jgi:hypothetical protein
MSGSTTNMVPARSLISADTPPAPRTLPRLRTYKSPFRRTRPLGNGTAVVIRSMEKLGGSAVPPANSAVPPANSDVPPANSDVPPANVEHGISPKIKGQQKHVVLKKNVNGVTISTQDSRIAHSRANVSPPMLCHNSFRVASGRILFGRTRKRTLSFGMVKSVHQSRPRASRQTSRRRKADSRHNSSSALS